jgi:hypothetical protein
MRKMMTDISGAHWPQHLYPYMYDHGDIELVCFVDWEPADRSVGMTGGAWLIHAFAGGVDVVDLLKDAIVKDIELEAALSIEQDQREDACSLSSD